MSHSGTTRRGALFGSVAGLAALTAGTARAEQAAHTASHPVTTQLTADEALALLKEGNASFETDAPYRGAIGRKRRLELAAGQMPFAVLVGCSDSRVSPELLFGRGLGELFIIRVAGNTVDIPALGSIEYAVGPLGVPLVVVLGHERCGAVQAAIGVVEENAEFPGRIGEMVEPILPAVLAARGMEGDLIANSVAANVRRVVASIADQSPIVREGVAAGKVKVVGAVYDLDDGHVSFLGEA
ncbi:carbonic anhydrase [Amaricoccus solimangrovi]|uniref:Carbonic anhydrase n=1 Tax=Amaricoccus solimangrovi TaxID=2589815 RepID=A0A501WKU4_9RHOB|nr:carbonic anhydrase [Amaricoccus solimangrovi]TPE50403.1 carbonic anhydrase [Amaricoccus solimangrovi]